MLRGALLGKVFRQYGHESHLMAAKFVSPYRMAGKSGKNDAADALRNMVSAQKSFYRSRFSNVLMIYWNTLIA